MNPNMMTEHQQRIAAFMKLAGQDLPAKPTMPSLEVRMLRAKLIFEESLETIHALGIAIDRIAEDGFKLPLYLSSVSFSDGRSPNLAEIADGCADISVVTIGTLLAFGIADKPLLEEVDRSNLAKFELPKCELHPDVPMEHLADKHGSNNLGNYRCSYRGMPILKGNPRCDYHARGPYRREDGKWIKGPDWKEPDIDGAIMQSDAPDKATIKSWTAEQFDEAKNQLVAFQEFKAAEELVKVIKRLKSGEDFSQEALSYIRESTLETPSQTIGRIMQHDGKTPHCPECRGILSQKLVSNIIAQSKNIPCPNCMKPVELESIIYA